MTLYWPVTRRQPTGKGLMTRKLITAPASEPITSADAKSFCRVAASVTADDGLFASLITASRLWVEDFTQRALITQTWDVVFDDALGTVIELPYPPLVSVTGIYFTNSSDVEGAAEDASKYIVDVAADPGRIILKQSSDWSDTDLRDYAGSRIRFVAGYGSTAADIAVPTVGSVPADILNALRRIILHNYENRDEFVTSGGMRIPDGIREMLWGYRVMRVK